MRGNPSDKKPAVRTEVWTRCCERDQLAASDKPDSRRRVFERARDLIAGAMSVEDRGKALMAAVEQHDLEGIVAKRKSDPYRAGVHWWKIKNRAYSQVDDGRGELLNGDGRAVPRAVIR